jgi:hypothetical protein
VISGVQIQGLFQCQTQNLDDRYVLWLQEYNHSSLFVKRLISEVSKCCIFEISGVQIQGLCVSLISKVCEHVRFCDFGNTTARFAQAWTREIHMILSSTAAETMRLRLRSYGYGYVAKASGLRLRTGLRLRSYGDRAI